VCLKEYSTAIQNLEEQAMMLEQRAIGTFTSYELAENALRELKQTGFLMHQVSLIGKDINRHAESTGVHTNSTITDVNRLNAEGKDTGAGIQTGAAAGGTLGGITGLLVGLGAIAIPGIGPVMLAGAAATAIATAVSGTAIGAAAGSLAGGLTRMGFSADRAQTYSDQVSEGHYLVMIEGTAADITKAETVFTNHPIHGWHVYDLPSNTLQPVVSANRPL
jgi:hypothetical protein